MLTRKIQHIVAYPVSQGKLINVVIFVSDISQERTYLEGPAVVENTKDDFVSPFKNWEEEAHTLVKVRCFLSLLSSLIPFRWYLANIEAIQMGNTDFEAVRHFCLRGRFSYRRCRECTQG